MSKKVSINIINSNRYIAQKEETITEIIDIFQSLKYNVKIYDDDNMLVYQNDNGDNIFFYKESSKIFINIKDVNIVDNAFIINTITLFRQFAFKLNKIYDNNDYKFSMYADEDVNVEIDNYLKDYYIHVRKIQAVNSLYHIELVKDCFKDLKEEI